jgi:hypothetical protein
MMNFERSFPFIIYGDKTLKVNLNAIQIFLVMVIAKLIGN